MKRILAIILVLVLSLSLSGCNKSETLVAAEEAVKNIGQVTLESGEAIAAAEAAISALTKEDKEDFQLEDEFEAAKAEYEQLVAESEAAEVEKLIADIGEVSIDNTEKVDAAQSKYDSLSDKAKELVKNYDVLVSIQEQLSVEKKAKAEKLLSSMHVDEDRVRQMKFYYPTGWRHYSDYWAADIKSFVLPYIGMSGDDVWLRMVCNYTNDDWVFFEKITFAVDGKNYHKVFQYSDVVRDNDGGDVWEYVDIEVGDTELEILKAIANSTETIVRFEGDDYYDDTVISAEDKQGILEAITVYELLR